MKKTDANTQFLPTYNFAISAGVSRRRQGSNTCEEISFVFDSDALTTRACLVPMIECLNKNRFSISE